MATLVLGTIGALVGGPVGGALGALVGRGIDSAAIGGGRREGARLKDLAVTTSSYGQPLPRHFGRVRVAGSVIWGTDLVENRESGGGGKGRPKTTTYSYSSSFAVALASRPIAGLGRIWADGNLLRGAAGDLKTGGTMRLYRGHGDQTPDPLIAAAQGSACPAFRGCAYVVFEDLDLADFGNRIPALTFEVIADSDGFTLADLVEPLVPGAVGGVALPGLGGFSYEGGSLRSSLETIGDLFPLASDCAGARLTIASAAPPVQSAVALPEPVVVASADGSGQQAGPERERDAGSPGGPDAVRYYDSERDFQPGLQRSELGGGAGRTLEFPGTLAPDDARALVDAAGRRAHGSRERLSLRVAEVNPAIGPGALVRAPNVAGLWQVESWEWDEHGVALVLRRHPTARLAPLPGEAGTPALPPDGAAPPTLLRAFDLPWDGAGDSSAPPIYAAASAQNANWRGAALYLERAGVLEDLGPAGRTRSVTGALAAPLPPSPARLLERGAVLTIDLAAEDMALDSATAEALAAGANRLLVGGEIVQFAGAARETGNRWRLEGLLRGRGGTEAAAAAGHPAGTPATLLDAALVPLAIDRSRHAEPPVVAAIGRADDDPVMATVENFGRARKPLTPVHPRARSLPSGALALGWIRRARGAWRWLPEVEAPLVEEAERYRVGVGPLESPLASWETATPRLTIDADRRAALSASAPAAPVWVRQIGSFAASDPLHLCHLD
ncbi:phage tail protein [Pelagerythrobacter marensis]|uniref:Phage tail protein n=1 Tax=Pelagerythrobacter marensis TaxID=543877 RepID=A0ABZ2D4Q8_9SPHN